LPFAGSDGCVHTLPDRYDYGKRSAHHVRRVGDAAPHGFRCGVTLHAGRLSVVMSWFFAGESPVTSEFVKNGEPKNARNVRATTALTRVLEVHHYGKTGEQA
jgi:hypothetical protein